MSLVWQVWPNVVLADTWMRNTKLDTGTLSLSWEAIGLLAKAHQGTCSHATQFSSIYLMQKKRNQNKTVQFSHHVCDAVNQNKDLYPYALSYNMVSNERSFWLSVTLGTIKLPLERQVASSHPTHTLAGCSEGQPEVSSGGSFCKRALQPVAI